MDYIEIGIFSDSDSDEDEDMDAIIAAAEAADVGGLEYDAYLNPMDLIDEIL